MEGETGGVAEQKEEGEGVVEREKAPSEFEEGVELDESTFQRVSGWGWMGGVATLMYSYACIFSARLC